MGVEVRPLNVLCNIQCLYCYQHPQRDAGSVLYSYDLIKIKKAIELEGGPFALFGGEPLLVPLKDLEDLWSWGYERYGRNSIQTNATLISDEHIRLFHKYDVSVGISLDGPGELNDARWHGSLERTRESTAKAELAIERLCQEGIHPSLIITLHRGNATQDRLPVLIEWVQSLIRRGVASFRLHLLESESVAIRERLALTAEENICALRSFLDLSRREPQHFDLFDEMRNLLMGDDRKKTCVWEGCDSYTTRSVRGIERQGQRSNCGRTNKDGIDFVKADRIGFERYLSLYRTPQTAGGCNGCRFFLMCKGQCPGTAIDGDWRNRTEHCEVWKAIFELLENELISSGKEPLSVSARRPDIETQIMEKWVNHTNARLFDLVSVYPTTPHLNNASDGNPDLSSRRLPVPGRYEK